MHGPCRCATGRRSEFRAHHSHGAVGQPGANLCDDTQWCVIDFSKASRGEICSEAGRIKEAAWSRSPAP